MATIRKISLAGSTYNLQDKDAPHIVDAGTIVVPSATMVALRGGTITVSDPFTLNFTNPSLSSVYSEINEYKTLNYGVELRIKFQNQADGEDIVELLFSLEDKISAYDLDFLVFSCATMTTQSGGAVYVYVGINPNTAMLVSQGVFRTAYLAAEDAISAFGATQSIITNPFSGSTTTFTAATITIGAQSLEEIKIPADLSSYNNDIGYITELSLTPYVEKNYSFEREDPITGRTSSISDRIHNDTHCITATSIWTDDSTDPTSRIQTSLEIDNSFSLSNIHLSGRTTLYSSKVLGDFDSIDIVSHANFDGGAGHNGVSGEGNNVIIESDNINLVATTHPIAGSGLVNISGSTVTIVGVVTPTVDTMAANKKYVDDRVGSVTTALTNYVQASDLVLATSSTNVVTSYPGTQTTVYGSGTTSAVSEITASTFSISVVNGVLKIGSSIGVSAVTGTTTTVSNGTGVSVLKGLGTPATTTVLTDATYGLVSGLSNAYGEYF